MSEKKTIPHIRTPRSLLDDPLWEDLTPIQQHVFNVLLKNVCYQPRKFDDYGVILELQPGQMCTTIRGIQELCHPSITKNDVERSIKKLILCQIVRQEVRHRKSVITITHSDTYELIKNASETRSETNLRQSLDKLETQTKKVRKKEGNNIKQVAPQTSAGASASEPACLKISFSFEKSEFQNIQPEQIASWTKAYPGIDIPQEILRMQEWILANRERAPRSQHQSFIVRWLTRAQNFLANKPQYQKTDSRAILGGKRLTEYDNAY